MADLAGDFPDIFGLPEQENLFDRIFLNEGEQPFFQHLAQQADLNAPPTPAHAGAQFLPRAQPLEGGLQAVDINPIALEQPPPAQPSAQPMLPHAGPHADDRSDQAIQDAFVGGVMAAFRDPQLGQVRRLEPTEADDVAVKHARHDEGPQAENARIFRVNALELYNQAINAGTSTKDQRFMYIYNNTPLAVREAEPGWTLFVRCSCGNSSGPFNRFRRVITEHCIPQHIESPPAAAAANDKAQHVPPRWDGFVVFLAIKDQDFVDLATVVTEPLIDQWGALEQANRRYLLQIFFTRCAAAARNWTGGRLTVTTRGTSDVGGLARGVGGLAISEHPEKVRLLGYRAFGDEADRTTQRVLTFGEALPTIKHTELLELRAFRPTASMVACEVWFGLGISQHIKKGKSFALPPEAGQSIVIAGKPHLCTRWLNWAVAAHPEVTRLELNAHRPILVSAYLRTMVAEQSAPVVDRFSFLLTLDHEAVAPETQLVFEYYADR